LEKKYAFAVKGRGGGYGAQRGLLAATTLSRRLTGGEEFCSFLDFCLDPIIRGWYTLLIDKGQCAPQLKGKLMTNMMTPKELAVELDTDPKTVRKFLRSLTPDRAGKGGRWVIDANDLDAIKAKFADYSARRAAVFTLPADDDTDS